MNTLILPERCFALNRFLWKCTGFFIALDVFGLWYYGIRIDVSQTMYVPVLLAVCLLVSFFYRYVRKDPAIFLFCQLSSQLILLTAVLAILSYLTASFNFPLLDPLFIKADHYFAFDWHSWLNWVQNHLMFAHLLSAAYASGEPQMLVLMIVLFLCQKLPHIQRFMIAFFYTGVLVIFFAAFLPAMGGFVYYNIDINQLPHMPAAGRIHEPVLLALRAHSMKLLPFPLLGIITFPSFHSAMAVLLIYGSLPVRWLRVIFIPLNILMLISTPADGGHYLVDMIVGILIALHAVQTAKKMLPENAYELPKVVVPGN